MTLYWHVYGAEIPEMCEPDEGGFRAPAWGTITFGKSLMPANEVEESHPTVSIKGVLGVYLGSFDHEPTDGEMEMLAPEEYRTEEL